MDNYLVIKDTLTMKPKRFNSAHSAIEPVRCIISDSIRQGNDIELTIPYRATDELEIGDWVEVPSTDGKIWGGLILGKTIDKSRNSVTFRGASARGSLGGVRVCNNSDAIYKLYDPEGSRASEYETGNYTHNMRKILEHYNLAWGLPVEFTESAYIPQQIFVDFAVANTGYYVFEGVPYIEWSIIDWLNEYYKVCHQKSVMLVPSSVSNLLRVDMCPSVKHRYVITDETVIMSIGLGYTGVATRTKLAYINNNGDVAYQRFVAGSFDPSPSDLPNKMLQRYDFGTESNNAYSDLRLKNELLRIANVSPLETSIKINPEKLEADVGDVVEFVDTDLNITTEQTIIEKKLKIVGSNVSFEYVTGDTAK